jgi:hypothetical protein
MKNFLNRNALFILIIIVIEISVFAAYYYLSSGIVFGLVDANTRLNTARRAIDSLTPGLGQFGGIWPPFPHILMVPFVISDFLWRTAIAGWIISGTAYVLSAYFVFKAIAIMTSNRLAAFAGSLALVVNINLVYFQTSAMSESFFIMCISGMVYAFTKYIHTKSISALFIAAIFASLGSLTRFEGYAMVGASVFMLLLFFIVNRHTRHHSEGVLILYTLPASLGIILWSLYVTAIFGDPLYWLHYYGVVATDTASNAARETVRLNPLQASGVYITSIIHMCGLITFVLGLVGFLYSLASRENRKYSYLFFLPLAIFLFMVGSLTKNTVIIQPPITLMSLLDKSLDTAHEFNIRYGLSFLPFLTVFAFLLAKKSKFILLGIVLLLTLQTVAYFYTPLNLTYQLGKNRSYSVTSESKWMKKNYNGGLILISALRNDRQMNEFGLPYKRYIYEGTQKYWKTSLKKPDTYASWIFMRANSSDSDNVTKALRGKVDLEKYDLVYSKGDILIYKIKTKPKIIIDN